MTDTFPADFAPAPGPITGPVRVRIAPSPTGDPHVGTAYMALFNRAMADKYGGQFLFRLDDTDQSRRNETSERQIGEALKWLGIRYDEGPDIGGPHAPYRQSERLAIYWKYVEKMLTNGTAYRCFATSEELEVMRKIQMREGRPPMYDRRWREKSQAEVDAKLKEGGPWVVRVKMPLKGDVIFHDLLRGAIRIPATELDDKVIWKSDGFPTYHMANIVDDHEFGITHIIRGEEWIPSVPTHLVLMKALGFKPPVFCHMPLLRNSDKSKVSKRKNPTSLLWFRDAGFLPEGLLNFLGLMGFSLPNDQEVFTYAEFVKHYDPTRINTGGPVFDLQKLEWANGEHMKRLTTEDVCARLIAHIERVAGREADFGPLPPDDPAHQLGTFVDGFRLKTQTRNSLIAKYGKVWLGNRAMLEQIVPLIRERIHTLSEAADYLPPFFEEPPVPLAELEEIKKFTHEQKLDAVDAVLKVVEDADFGAPGIAKKMEEDMRLAVESRSWKAGPPFMTARLAALRAKISPPLFDSMLVLGKDVTLRRIREAREVLAKR